MDFPALSFPVNTRRHVLISTTSLSISI